MKPTSGFTLFEVLLALMIFSVAVIALVEAINGMGNASVEARRNQEIVARLNSLMTEVTRLPGKPGTSDRSLDKTMTENGVDYHVKITPVELANKDGQPLPNMYAVKATARWKDSGHPEEINAETIMYPPLYVPAP